MSNFLNFLGKLLLQLIFWVFVLSIQVEEEPLFNHLQGVLVDNKAVKFLEEEFNQLWAKVSKTAHMTFANAEGKDEMAQSPK